MMIPIKTRSENQKRFAARIRREIIKNLKVWPEKQVEKWLAEYSYLVGKNSLFQAALTVFRVFPNVGIHYVAKSASPEARAWLKKRISNLVVQEAMEVWLLN